MTAGQQLPAANNRFQLAALSSVTGQGEPCHSPSSQRDAPLAISKALLPVIRLCFSLLSPVVICPNHAAAALNQTVFMQ